MGFGVKDIDGSPSTGDTGVQSIETDEDGETSGAPATEDSSEGGEEASFGDTDGSPEPEGETPVAGAGKSDSELAELRALKAEFGPHIPAIRAAMQRGFLSPEQAREGAQAVASGAAPPAPTPTGDPWADKKAYDKWWAEVTDDPKAFRDGLYREIDAAPGVKNLAARLDAFEKAHKQDRAQIDQVRGRVLFDNWIKANGAQKHAKRIEELIDQHGVRKIETAYAIAKDEADAKAFRASQVGGAAPAVAGTRPSPGRKPVPPTASGARNRVAGGRGAGVPGSAVTQERGGSLMRRSLTAAMSEISKKK